MGAGEGFKKGKPDLLFLAVMPSVRSCSWPVMGTGRYPHGKMEEKGFSQRVGSRRDMTYAPPTSRLSSSKRKDAENWEGLRKGVAHVIM